MKFEDMKKMMKKMSSPKGMKALENMMKEQQ